MAKLTYRKHGEIGKKVPLNHYQKMMILSGFSVAMNIMVVVWIILNHLRT